MRRLKRFLLVVAAISVVAVTFAGCAPSEFKLTTAYSPSAGGSVSPSSGSFSNGLLIKVTATPTNGYRFDHWEGAVSITTFFDPPLVDVIRLCQ